MKLPKSDLWSNLAGLSAWVTFALKNYIEILQKELAKVEALAG
jgi:hypothetical protein